MSRFPGPDMRRLAAAYATRVGPEAVGGHCPTCDAPVVPSGASSDGREHWLNDWPLLSLLAQHDDSGVKNPRPARRNARVRRRRCRRLQRPTHGVSDDFLRHVADAYLEAVRDGKAQAPELARQIGDPNATRTVRKWVYRARQRRILPPSERHGKGN